MDAKLRNLFSRADYIRSVDAGDPLSDIFTRGDYIHALCNRTTRWYCAKIISIDKGRIEITWPGFKESENEWISRDDLKSRTKPLGTEPITEMPSKLSYIFHKGQSIQAFCERWAWVEATIKEIDDLQEKIEIDKTLWPEKPWYASRGNWLYRSDIQARIRVPFGALPTTVVKPLKSKAADVAVGTPVKSLAADAISLERLLMEFNALYCRDVMVRSVGTDQSEIRWSSGRIAETGKDRIRISWDGDSNSEWIPMSAVSTRLRDAGKPIANVPNKLSSIFQQGQTVEALCRDGGRWCEASILEVTEEGVKIHWKGWSEKWNMWITKNHIQDCIRFVSSPAAANIDAKAANGPPLTLPPSPSATAQGVASPSATAQGVASPSVPSATPSASRPSSSPASVTSPAPAPPSTSPATAAPSASSLPPPVPPSAAAANILPPAPSPASVPPSAASPPSTFPPPAITSPSPSAQSAAASPSATACCATSALHPASASVPQGAPEEDDDLHIITDVDLIGH